MLQFPKYLLVILLVLSSLHSPAQEKGCFKETGIGKLELTTDIDFSEYNIFFLGEFHGVYGVPEIKLSLIKYLNTTYGIRDVFIEAGLGAAWLYNQYLATGDTSLMYNPSILYGDKLPNKLMWQNLYEYNKTLKDKIRIYGMDFERIEFLKVLKILKPKDHTPPTEIDSIITYIDTVNIGSKPQLHSDVFKAQNEIYEHLRTSFSTHENAFKEYYGANFKTVKSILTNKDTYSNFAIREKTMFENVTEQTKEEGITKYIIFSGLNHGNSSYSIHRSLCYRLGKRRRNKIANISMICQNCYDWQARPTIQPYRAQYTYVKDTTTLLQLYKTNFNPYCKYTLLPSSITDNDNINANSNFILLMKDQPEY